MLICKGDKRTYQLLQDVSHQQLKPAKNRPGSPKSFDWRWLSWFSSGDISISSWIDQYGSMVYTSEYSHSVSFFWSSKTANTSLQASKLPGVAAYRRIMYSILMDQCYKSLGHKSAVLWMLFHPFCRNELKIAKNKWWLLWMARICQNPAFVDSYVNLIQVLQGLIRPFDIPMKSWHWINTNDPLLPEFARNPSCFMFTKSCRANSHWKPAHVDTPITRGEDFFSQQLKLWQKVPTWSQSVFAEMVFGGSKLLTHDMLGMLSDRIP